VKLQSGINLPKNIVLLKIILPKNIRPQRQKIPYVPKAPAMKNIVKRRMYVVVTLTDVVKILMWADFVKIRIDVVKVRIDVQQIQTDVRQIRTNVRQIRTDGERIRTDIERIDVVKIRTDVARTRTDVVTILRDGRMAIGAVVSSRISVPEMGKYFSRDGKK